MRNHALALTMLLMSTVILHAQEPNQRITDERSGREILIGNVTREGLENFGEWFNSGYQQYTPDSKHMDTIRRYETEYPDIFIVLGTWCGDSREQLPYFFKILDQLDYPPEKVSMIAVDRDKNAGNYKAADNNIQLVPTFIFTMNGKETGHIIETPERSLEQDFLNILQNSTSVAHD